jgi:hypothetical protein
MISPSLRLEIARLGRLLLEAIARAGEPSIESPSRGESWPGSPPLIILITLGRAKVCTEQVRGTFPVTRRGIVRRGVTTPYSSNYRPPPRLRPPTETLWKIRREHVTWSCELRFHGESYGWEAQILRDSGLVIGRRFLLRELAIRWANEEQFRLGKDTEPN